MSEPLNEYMQPKEFTFHTAPTCDRCSRGFKKGDKLCTDPGTNAYLHNTCLEDGDAVFAIGMMKDSKTCVRP